MRARGVRVAHQGRAGPTSSPFASSATRTRSVGMALERTDVAALVARAAPARVGEEPALLLARDGARRARRRSAASPGPRRRTRTPSALIATRLRHRLGEGRRRRPRSRREELDGGGAAEEEVAPTPADDVVAELARARSSSAGSCPPSQWTCGSSTWTRGAPIAALDAEAVLEHVDHDLHDRAAEPRRARAPDDEARAAVDAERDRRRHHARQAHAGARRRPPTRSCSPSMLLR